ncbi:hypothetical protein SAMN05444368_1969 [Acetomicrobium flavidum]|uniref:Uncharacterized protein n=1 Tax=Acetomicrobium flavidum TaxID=49896 RepID=A0ABY1JFS0_9BACT|nr:hypothetical protein SAMN05444368_1969 [Acetomicrobium flavidum]
MRTINYDEHVERIVEKIKEKSMRQRMTGKSRLDMPLRSNKMHDPQEERALFLLDYYRWRKALASGEIEKLDPRRYHMKWVQG